MLGLTRESARHGIKPKKCQRDAPAQNGRDAPLNQPPTLISVIFAIRFPEKDFILHLPF